ncbi:hypothetical protein VNO78_33271 [Psophocarpus tetragonolobus]|uniref:Uncharacterized protein n=1 Tax=Psophocarpus tetragonolobus TaxID=3891 RepID=A0AAN9P228_PSOTE
MPELVYVFATPILQDLRVERETSHPALNYTVRRRFHSRTTKPAFQHPLVTTFSDPPSPTWEQASRANRRVQLTPTHNQQTVATINKPPNPRCVTLFTLLLTLLFLRLGFYRSFS